ncbi:baseplate J/gp47 family protein [Treponema denticola]|uniref:baseplate J/gp47 family protein n=1 Tax=Treponema denticola TaxID=158 RepID=UPI0020A5F536|nr:baseplate J/gp47 family protein [Treponema denticola]UTD07118.1 baseplate J/gp47 family protein [Treponema denticola]
MAYKNKTIKEVEALLINSFEHEFNKKLRLLPKSFIRVFCRVLAGVFIILYKQIGWCFLQLFPETADWQEVTILGQRIRPLVKLGALFGIGEPLAGVQWQGIIEVDVLKTGGVLYSGTQLKSSVTGKLYVASETKTLLLNKESVKVVCTEIGTAGNLEVNDVLNFVNPYGFIKSEAVILEVERMGLDEELEANYRERLINRFRLQPQGGALADYRIWAADVPGVLRVYPYNDKEQPGGVLLYVSGIPSVFNDRIPDKGLLKKVGEVCTYDPETGKAIRKPLTAMLDPKNDGSYENIKPVSVVEIEVAVTGVTGIAPADFAELIKPALKNYFLDRDLYIRGLSDDNNRTNVISKNHVITVINQIAVTAKAVFEDVVLKKENVVFSSYVLDDGKLAKLGAFSINGVSY